MVIAPPAIYLLAVQDILRKDVKVSAQNAYFKPSGSFTGEIRCVCVSVSGGPCLIYSSPAQLADAQVPYVILGTPAQPLSLPLLT